jgi:hypothetical protein
MRLRTGGKGAHVRSSLQAQAHERVIYFTEGAALTPGAEWAPPAGCHELAGPPRGGATMDSQTKHDFWIMAVAMLVVVAVTTVTFAVLMTQLN